MPSWRGAIPKKEATPVVLRQEAILEDPDLRAVEGLAVGILLGIVGLGAFDGEGVGFPQFEVRVLGKHS